MKDRSGNCSKCGTWRRSLHRDRIVPGWKGGTYEPSNVQLLCANCHEDKTREDLKGRKHTPERIEAMRLRGKDPEQVAKRRAGYTSEVRSKMSLQARERCEDKEYRDHLAEISLKGRTKVATDPAIKQKLREQAQRQWAERRAKGLTGALGSEE